MSQKSSDQIPPSDHFNEWLERIATFTPNRSVRRIVTRRGKGVRGNFPSRKAPKRLQFESLVEERVLRVFEVSSLPRVIRTQPCVLELPGDTAPLRYTPDVQTQICEEQHFFESKADGFVCNEEERDRIKNVARRMRQQGFNFTLILDGDVRLNGLQEELTELLRERPLVGRYRDDIDANAWDPLSRHVPDAEMERRWLYAQRVCDELLARVMKRDPDDLIAAMTV